MNPNKTFLVILFFALSISFSYAQTNVPPGNIKFLPGYIHKRLQGIDTVVGKISKKNGLNIEYDIGVLAGNYAEGAYLTEKEKLVWSKTQSINKHDLRITYLKDGTIYATFDKLTNFISNVKTNEELTDFLLMIMTYGSKDDKASPQKTQ